MLILISILVFQNCGRVILSSEKDSQNSALGSGAFDVEAEDIINTMMSAGIKDDFEFDETINLSADAMTCGIKTKVSKPECLFTKEKLTYSTSAGTAANVKKYLSQINIDRDCPACIDSESYTVKNIKCKRIPNFPHDSTCEFTR